MSLPLESSWTLLSNGRYHSEVRKRVTAYLLPAPFTFSPFAPCCLAFFHHCSLFVFSLLPFYFFFAPCSFLFIPQCSLIIWCWLSIKAIGKQTILSRSGCRFVKWACLEIYICSQFALCCLFPSKNCAPCPLITISMLPATLTILALAPCSLVSKRAFSLISPNRGSIIQCKEYGEITSMLGYQPIYILQIL